MPVTEERLTAAVTRVQRLHPRQYERNPVAGLIVESMAVSHRDHEQGVRDAGAFLLDLLCANDPDAPCLTLPVAMQVLLRDEAKPADELRCHLADMARRDVLLGIAVHAIVGRCTDRWAKVDGEVEAGRQAVLRTLFLLLRMFEAQEEADALDRQLRA